MCGIIAVMRRVSRRQPPSADILEAAVAAVVTALDSGTATSNLDEAARLLAELNKQLQGTPGLEMLLAHPDQAQRTARELANITERVEAFEATLYQGGSDSGSDIEQQNAALVRLKDALWAVACDRLPHALAVRELWGVGDVPTAAATALSSIQAALAALDRLEVRGRDSAGLSVMVSGVDLDAPTVRDQVETRGQDSLFTDSSVRRHDNKTLDIVYKHAAEIGELGDNVRSLRATIQNDTLLRALLQQPSAEVLVVGHTRWASVGVISQANAHPLNGEEQDRQGGPYVIGALNGDVDNHHDLVEQHGLSIAPEITTDAKVIPTLVSRQMAQGHDIAEAFRRTVSAFEGSVAIATASSDEPERLALALRGSGQALYIGVAEDTFIVASEPYGVIEECDHYLRMDGETPGNPDNPSASRGQVIVLERTRAGEVAGINRAAYDGTPLPVEEGNLTAAAITTRDIDRRGFFHYLHKEISEAPVSLLKTLRGRIAQHGNQLRVALPDSCLPRSVVNGMAQQRFRRILVIGQGTAAVAGQAVAAAIAESLRTTSIEVRPVVATELSGFGMDDDMSDTLVVAISQSGTTTDTNRTVDLVKSRGAPVIAIVNRRGSDLTDKANGVDYTSDGRDVEMSVASTKAFYAQCAAGFLLALGLARAAGVGDGDAEHSLLQALNDLPDAMREVLAQDDAITAIAKALAPQRRYWALVGNGNNRIAAAEVRIKLSELCYKSIACDVTEDKKHIDLSSEPMILVCAAGLTGSTADDVAKEVAIYQAHKACPIVIASSGDTRFSAAAASITVPQVHPSLAYILSTMAGHLFGYRAALTIDELAMSLRRARGAIEQTATALAAGSDPLAELQPRLQPHWIDFRKDLLLGRYDGTLEARTAARLSSLFNYAMGLAPLDSYAVEFGMQGAPGAIIDTLTEELTEAIDQLTRPVDAIKHQAKTVTVGISRSDEALLTVPLVKEALAAGAHRDAFGYRDLRALAGLDPAVTEVLGSTRYRIDWTTADSRPDTDSSVHVLSQTGVAAKIRSRTQHDPRLRGTKHLVAMEKTLFVACGRSDGRTVILLPEVEQNRTTGITLLHVKLQETLPATTMRGVLSSYRNRYAALKDAVTETESSFDETLLEQMPVVDLLTQPLLQLADRWRQGRPERSPA